MNIPKLVWVLLAFSFPLLAQEHRLTIHELGAYYGGEDQLRSAMNYCDAIDDFSQEQQPRLFAELRAGSMTESKTSLWREFGSKEEWDVARKPAPLAFVWDRNGTIVRVTIVANPPRVWKPHIASPRTEYCYGANTKLMRIRAVWSIPTNCEFLFPCQLIRGHEFFLAQRPGITDWVFTAGGQIRKLWNGEVRNDYFDPSYSLNVSDLPLGTSDHLPFSHVPNESPSK